MIIVMSMVQASLSATLEVIEANLLLHQLVRICSQTQRRLISADSATSFAWLLR